MNDTNIKPSQTVWIVDDDERFCQTLKQILAKSGCYNVIGISNTLKDAYKALVIHQPDLVTVDLSLPDGNGVELIKWLDLHLPDIHKIIVSFWGQENLVFSAFMYGTHGYIQKDHLLTMTANKALATFDMGGTPINPKLATKILTYFQSQADNDNASNIATLQLTEQETVVLERLIQGLDYDEIEDELYMVDDVSTHMMAIYHKLNISAKHTTKKTLAIVTNSNFI